mmetsp:Transcript_57804/g.181508  ORF Transcript_57804/g.181508 Transcript_57804/m.181508 type:complete len:221 (+) Transcript_57804:410-1072(+)
MLLLFPRLRPAARAPQAVARRSLAAKWSSCGARVHAAGPGISGRPTRSSTLCWHPARSPPQAAMHGCRSRMQCRSTTTSMRWLTRSSPVSSWHRRPRAAPAARRPLRRRRAPRPRAREPLRAPGPRGQAGPHSGLPSSARPSSSRAWHRRARARPSSTRGSARRPARPWPSAAGRAMRPSSVRTCRGGYIGCSAAELGTSAPAAMPRHGGPRCWRHFASA